MARWVEMTILYNCIDKKYIFFMRYAKFVVEEWRMRKSFSVKKAHQRLPTHLLLLQYSHDSGGMHQLSAVVHAEAD